MSGEQIYGVVMVVSAVLTGYITARKSKPELWIARFRLGALIGLILGPLGPIAAAIYPGDVIRCPACRKQVSNTVRECPVCGASLVGLSSEQPSYGFEEKSGPCVACGRELAATVRKCPYCFAEQTDEIGAA